MPLSPDARVDCVATVPTQNIQTQPAAGRQVTAVARTQPPAPCIEVWLIPVMTDATGACSLAADWHDHTAKLDPDTMQDPAQPHTLRCITTVDFAGRPVGAAVLLLFLCTRTRVREFNHPIELSDAALAALAGPADRVFARGPADGLILPAGFVPLGPTLDQMKEAVLKVVANQGAVSLQNALVRQPGRT